MISKIGIDNLNRNRFILFFKDVDSISFLMLMVFSCLLFIDRDTVNLVMFVFLSLALVKIKQSGYTPSKYLYFVLLFIAGILISLLGANQVTLGLDELRKTIKWIFLPIVILQFDLKLKEKKSIIYPIFISTTVYLFLALMDILSGAKERIDAGYAISQYSINLVFMIIIYSAILIWSEGESKDKKISFVGLVISVVLLIMSGTRAAWISTSICLIAMLFTKKKYSVLCMFLFLISSGVVVALAGNAGIVSKRLKNYESSMNARFEVYIESYRLFREHSVNGIGFANFFDEQDVKNYDKPRKYSHSHNMILKIACETGLIGLLSYVAFKCFIFILLARNMRQDIFAFIGFYVFLALEVYDLSQVTFRKHYSYAIAFFLLGIALQSIYEKKKRTLSC